MFLMLVVGALLVLGAVQLFHWLLGRSPVPALHTRRVFVTGCDTGFGRRLALRLDKMGCHVFAACLTSSGASQLSQDTSERVKTLVMDVTKDEDIERAGKEVEEMLPDNEGLWAIVNNAGIFGSTGPSEMMTRKEFLAPLQVNLLGMTQVTRVFLPLVRRCRGRIVNTTSVVGRFALSPSPYVASKFAAVGYTDMLRRELYHHGVTVHSIEPGAYDTNLLDDKATRGSMEKVFRAAPPHVQKVYGEDYMDKMMALVADMKRYVVSRDPEEVVDAYVHALTSQRPSLSYTVGCNGNLFFRPLTMLPTALADWLVTRAMSPPKDQ
ncbi:hypothetical protein ACOMHN_012264 [Nucella lapillus]